jgi:hypothetical protein
MIPYPAQLDFIRFHEYTEYEVFIPTPNALARSSLMQAASMPATLVFNQRLAAVPIQDTIGMPVTVFSPFRRKRMVTAPF